MKILITQKIAGISGSELYIKTLLLELNKRGIVADFLAMEPKGSEHLNDDFINEIIENGINVFRVPYRGPFSLRLYYHINKILKKGDYDILQTNLLHADIIGGITKLIFRHNIKIISTKHGYDEAYIKEYGFNSKSDKFIDFYAWTSKFSNLFIDNNISVSKGLAKLLVDTKLIKSDKIEIIPLGFDFSYIQNSNETEKYRLSNNQMIIIGRLVPLKQHHLVIEILPDIIKEIPDIKLLIVGEGNHKQELEKLSTQMKVDKSVIFTGFCNNIHDYLTSSDIELLPSSAEGFGVVILEAWHSEVPVIAFDVPAPNEIITDGVDGYLIPPFDKEILKEKIIYLLKNKDFAKNMGKAGKEKLASQYTMDIMLDRTIAMYNRVLNEA